LYADDGGIYERIINDYYAVMQAGGLSAELFFREIEIF